MTVILVVVTCLVSIACFSQRDLFERFQFNPFKVYHNKQYYRLLTHGFVHADWIHLIVNMIALYSFGMNVEFYFKMFREDEVIRMNPTFLYLLLYFSAIIISSIPTLKKYRDDYWYNAVGASGAVSAVVFTSIFFNPWQQLGLYFIIPVPGIIFGVLYLWYSQYMSRRNSDNINHDAHIFGALYGITFPVIINPKLFWFFLHQLVHVHF